MDEIAAKLQATTDAQVWAGEWCRLARARRLRHEDVMDEEWMVGWFANAIEVGREAGRKSAVGE